MTTVTEESFVTVFTVTEAFETGFIETLHLPSQMSILPSQKPFVTLVTPFCDGNLLSQNTLFFVVYKDRRCKG